MLYAFGAINILKKDAVHNELHLFLLVLFIMISLRNR